MSKTKISDYLNDRSLYLTDFPVNIDIEINYKNTKYFYRIIFESPYSFTIIDPFNNIIRITKNVAYTYINKKMIIDIISAFYNLPYINHINKKMKVRYEYYDRTK